MELNHLAIIMDGNRRWAVLNNRPSYEGHRFGADNLWKVIKDIDNYSINYLTLFVFSTENWKRSKKEILFLLALLEKFIDDLESKIEDYNYKIRFIGDFSKFSKKIQQKILYINKITNKKPGMTITLALNYGGRYDIVCAINNILKNSDMLKHIKQEDFKDFTLNASIPDPDLLIRTGGEKRLSNFIMYNLTYTEIFFIETLWPDFNFDELKRLIIKYKSIKRTYGL